MVSAYNTTVTPCQERDYGDAQQTLTGGYCSNHFTAIEACKASTRCIAGPCGSKGVIFPADTAEEDSPNGYSDCAEWGPFCGIQTYCFFLCVEHFSKLLVSTVCISTAIFAICLQVLCLWIHHFLEFIGSLQF